jgi:propionyl-CoA synthetase
MNKRVPGRDRRLRHAARYAPGRPGAGDLAGIERAFSYMLYTSGTTGKPKGVQRDVGGYAVALASSMKYIFGCKAGETFFATSDIGWVVGHSYIVYGPLIGGMRPLMYEGCRPIPIRASGGASSKSTSVTHDVLVRPRDPRAEEAAAGLHAQARPVVAASALFLAGEPLDEPPRTGSPMRSACRSSTTTGRPKPAGPC